MQITTPSLNGSTDHVSNERPTPPLAQQPLAPAPTAATPTASLPLGIDVQFLEVSLEPPHVLDDAHYRNPRCAGGSPQRVIIDVNDHDSNAVSGLGNDADSVL